MQAESNPANFGQRKHAAIQGNAIAIFGIRQGVVTTRSLETRIARFLSSCDAPKERLKGQINTLDDILQDMGMDVFVLWPQFLDGRQFALLLVVTNGHLPHAPRLAPLLKGCVVEFAATPERPVQFCGLLWCRNELVLVRFAAGLSHAWLSVLLGVHMLRWQPATRP